MANAWHLEDMGDIGDAPGMGDPMDTARMAKDIMNSRNENRLNETYTLSYDYSIVGIDANKVEPTIQMIDSYVKKLEEKVKTINENADMNQALKSEEIQLAVKNYISKVEEYCANLCSMLRHFQYKLGQARYIWENRASSLADKISTDASTINTASRLD